MKQRNAIFQLLIFVILLLPTSFRPILDQIHFSGKVFSDDKNLNDQVAGLRLFVKTKNKLIAETFTNAYGYYKLSFTLGSQQSFDFFITSIGIDTTFLKSFTTFEGAEITWDIKFPNTYNKRMGQVICPKCNKTNKVYPISYGDAQMSQEIIINGDTTYSNLAGNVYYAGSCVSNRQSPQYYCDRDKIKF